MSAGFIPSLLVWSNIWFSLFIHHAFTQYISASNDTGLFQSDDRLHLLLTILQARMTIQARIEPLTSDAGLNQPSTFLKNIRLTGPLVLTDPTTAATLTSTDIAYIGCEEFTHGRDTTPSAVLKAAASHKPVAIVLYSTYSNRCNYIHTDNNFDYVNIFTMASPSALFNLEIGLKSTQPSLSQAQIAQDNSTSTNSTNGSPGNSNSGNVLGASPTTAVAMIILYSITGVITALFLIIIITGAVRAHRHPERYGPRSAADGRPRQSRAKGIARAMLETLPIVKFGEKEEAKTNRDAELGGINDGPTNENGESSSAEPQPTTARNIDNDVERRTSTENPEIKMTPAINEVTPAIDEVSPAVDEVTPVVDTSNKVDGVDTRKSEELPKEGRLGCSICTEDFVKGEDVRVLPCNHQYHPECIDPWLLNVSGTCPLCRIDLRPAPTNSSGDGRESQAGNRSSFPSSLFRGDDGEHRPRMSRFLEFHLGLTPYSAPEERIAALLRLREMNREEGSSTTRRRSRSNLDNTRPISQRLSGLGLIRDPFRRRSTRIDGSDAGASVAENNSSINEQSNSTSEQPAASGGSS